MPLLEKVCKVIETSDLNRVNECLETGGIIINTYTTAYHDYPEDQVLVYSLGLVDLKRFDRGGQEPI